MLRVPSYNLDFDQALSLYIKNGLSIIPCRLGGKEPLIAWKEYQERQPGQEEIAKWISESLRSSKNPKLPFNIGVVCGKVSGNLVVLDFESEDAFESFYRKVEEAVSSKLLRNEVSIALANTWIVRTGKGYHVYLRVSSTQSDFESLCRTKIRLINGLDVKGEGGYVIAPPSLHPTGATYTFVFNDPRETSISTISISDFKALLHLFKHEEPEKEEPREKRQLSEKQILEIVELLKEAYRPGNRDFIVFYLTGWLKKAGVSYESARRIVELLAEQDEERDSRIYVLDRTYGLRGTQPSEDELKGKTGLQELLEEALGEERALEVIRRIEELLGVSSPFRDSIIELLDYEKQIYAIANLRRLIIARGRKADNKLVYKERIAPIAPTKVVVYQNPLGGITKYEIVFEGSTLRRPLIIGPALIEDIIGRLRAEGLVYHKRLIDDVLNALIQGYIRKGKAEVKEEIEAPGFYLINGKILVVRWEIKEVSEEELKEALELLDELATKWFGHAQERFATVIKWYMIAPFIYIYKQKKRWIKWLYLYGDPDTGKSTQSKIGASIWSLSLIEKPGSGVSSPARLEKVLSEGTFPVMIKEPGEMLNNEAVTEMIKSAIEDVLARGKFVRGAYVETPALAPIVFTSNRYVPKDPGLIKRLLILNYTYGERIPPEKQDHFKKEVESRFSKLGVLGHWIAKRIVDNPELLEMDWMQLSTKLLKEAYEEAGLEAPSWIELWYRIEENVYEDIKETIRNYLLKRINEEYNRFVGRVLVEKPSGYTELAPKTELSFEDRVRVVLENMLLPWARLKDGEVIITTGFVNEVRSVTGDIGGLKSIAELLNWEYRKSMKLEKRVIQAIVVKLQEFIDFLNMNL